MTPAIQMPEAKPIAAATYFLPILQQSAADAAFQWRQVQDSLYSHLHTLADIDQLQRRLQANLDGLALGAQGWAVAQKNLGRFKHAGEAFVAWSVALAQQRYPEMQGLWRLCSAHGDNTWEGMLTAFARCSPAYFGELSRVLLRSDEPDKLAFALHAAALHHGHWKADLPAHLRRAQHDALHSRDSQACAAALALLATQGDVRDFSGLLRIVQMHDSPEVLRLGVVAMSSLGLRRIDSVVGNTLQGMVRQLGQVMHQARGHARWVAERHLMEAAMYLAHGLPLGQHDPAWLQTLPGSYAAIFVGHHGDVQLVPLLLQHMQDPAHAPAAFAAFCMLSGADLQDSRLHKQVSGSEAPARDPSRATAGLPQPDAAAVQAWWASRAGDFKARKLYLAGQPANVAWCERLLNHSATSQTQRLAAMLHLRAIQPSRRSIDIRSPSFGLSAWPGATE